MQKCLTLGVRSNEHPFFYGFFRLASCTNSAFFSQVDYSQIARDPPAAGGQQARTSPLGINKDPREIFLARVAR
jgi:hypothetical protein